MSGIYLVHNSLRSTIDFKKKKFVVPPSGGSVGRRNLPAKAGTTNNHFLEYYNWLGGTFSLPFSDYRNSEKKQRAECLEAAIRKAFVGHRPRAARHAARSTKLRLANWSKTRLSGNCPLNWYYLTPGTCGTGGADRASQSRLDQHPQTQSQTLDGRLADQRRARTPTGV